MEMRQVTDTILNRNLGVIKKHRKEIKRMSRKLLADIKKKRPKKSRQTVNKNQRGSIQAEERHPLALLPEEIWLLVFDNGPLDEDDLRNCFNTCQFFKHLLMDKFIKAFFKPVFLYVFPMLKRADLLNCRRVCKKWKDSVDEILAIDDQHFFTRATHGDSRGTLFLDRVALDKIIGPYKFYLPFSSDFIPPSSWNPTGRHHNSIREQLILHDKNPFIGNRVKFFLGDQLIPACHEGIQFLRTIGQYIFHLWIFCASNDFETLDFKQFCYASLKLCPNLKTISINSYISFAGYFTVQFEQRQLIQELQDNIDPWDLEKSLLRTYGPNLKTVTIQHWENFMGDNWQKLSRLTVGFELDIHDLNRLMAMNIPSLKRLNIKWCNVNDDYWFSKLIGVVRRFQTLSFLVITVDNPTSGNVFANHRSIPGFYSKPKNVAPQTLFTLAIEGKHCLYNYDFLLYFPLLRELRIHCINAPEICRVAGRRTDDTATATDIGATFLALHKGWGYTEQIRVSNVWKHLPLLTELYITRSGIERKFTREAYEHYSKKRGKVTNKAK